jgi:ComF family protein
LLSGIDMLLPPACLLCGQLIPPAREGIFLCSACLTGMPPIAPGHCPRCARPYPHATMNHLCGPCLKRPIAFTAANAARRYEGVARDAVQRLKFRGRLDLAAPLGQLLDQALVRNQEGFLPHCIVPVPLHPRRLRQRGYNQALEIARPVARRMQVQLDSRLLARIRPTDPQQELPAAARRSNVRHAFTLTKSPAGQRVLLIDDVMTTGETAWECCRILRAGGAAQIRVAVFARA